MGNGMNKILPGLFLGNIIDAKDLDQLSKNNITHIVSIHESPQPFIPGITYLRIVLPDTPEANINFLEMQNLADETISDLMKDKPARSILRNAFASSMPVDCKEETALFIAWRVSRSTTIVLAYLMAVTQLGWHEALEAVKAVRPVANPNLGFCQQLEDFGRSQSVQKIRRRLERKYGGTPFHDTKPSESFCRPAKGRSPQHREGFAGPGAEEQKRKAHRFLSDAGEGDVFLFARLS